MLTGRSRGHVIDESGVELRFPFFGVNGQDLFPGLDEHIDEKTKV